MFDLAFAEAEKLTVEIRLRRLENENEYLQRSVGHKCSPVARFKTYCSVKWKPPPWGTH